MRGIAERDYIHAFQFRESGLVWEARRCMKELWNLRVPAIMRKDAPPMTYETRRDLERIRDDINDVLILDTAAQKVAAE